MVEILNLWAGRWLEAVWKVSWQSGILIVVIFLITRIFRQRLTPTVRHLLWTLVIAKFFITPFFVSVPVTIPIKTKPAPAPIFQEIMPIALPAETQAISQPSPTITEVKTAPVPFPETPKPKVTLRLSFLLFSLWISGVIVFLLGITIHSFRLCRQLSSAEPLENKDILEMVNHGAKELKIRPPKLKTSEKFASPLVCGIFRPVLIIPRQILAKFQPKELEPIILHELAHIKRRDILINWLQILAQTFYFFNPLIWYVNRQIRLEREQACDDWALQTNKGERKDYADALLNVIELGFKSKNFALSIMGISEPFTLMSRRLKMIMDTGRKISTKISLKVLLSLVVVGLVIMPAYAITKKPVKGTLLALQENTSVGKDVDKEDSALVQMEVQMDKSSSIAFTVTREWEECLLTEVWVVQPEEKEPKHIKTYLGFADISLQPRNGELFVESTGIIRAHFGNKPYGGSGAPIVTEKFLFLKGDGSERTITSPFSFNLRNFGRSPDGKRILYNSPSNKEDAIELWVMKADGSNKRKLISESREYSAPEFAWADAIYALVKTKSAFWKINVETGSREKIFDLTEENAKLNQQEENDLREAASLIADGTGFYVNGEEARRKGEIADARNYYAKAIENFNKIVKECPEAKVSVQNLSDCVEKFSKLKEMTSEENAEEVCEYHMYFIMGLLKMFLRENESKYPDSLADLLNWSLQKEWQINEIKPTDTEKIKLMFHCIAKSGSNINYNYTKIPLDAPDGTPVIVCERHPGKIVMVVKDKRGFKVIKKDK